MIIFLAIVVIGIIVLLSNVDTGSESTTAKTTQTTVIKKVIPPIGKKLSWDSIEDICFALGSFMACMNANGFIGAYENGTLGFNIRNITPTFHTRHERVPSDILEFLARNPSILKQTQIGEITTYQLEFSKSFPITPPRTKENIEKATEAILKIVQENLQAGANKTTEITGNTRVFSFHVESPEYTASKTLWIK